MIPGGPAKETFVFVHQVHALTKSCLIFVHDHRTGRLTTNLVFVHVVQRAMSINKSKLNASPSWKFLPFFIYFPCFYTSMRSISLPLSPAHNIRPLRCNEYYSSVLRVSQASMHEHYSSIRAGPQIVHEVAVPSVVLPTNCARAFPPKFVLPHKSCTT